MAADDVSALRRLEGRRVCVALADGSRIDDCILVSVGRQGRDNLWVFTNRVDRFLPHSQIIDCWEAA